MIRMILQAVKMLLMIAVTAEYTVGTAIWLHNKTVATHWDIALILLNGCLIGIFGGWFIAYNHMRK